MDSHLRTVADGQGRTVDFRNTVIVMTSNVGSELITSRGMTPGFGSPHGGDPAAQEVRALQDTVLPRLRKVFRPEFLNRIDEIIVFRRLVRHDVTVDFGRDAVRHIAELGYEPEFGARSLRRTIQPATPQLTCCNAAPPPTSAATRAGP